MPVNIKEKGDYELFETTRDHRILVLNGEQWFARVEGQQGEILVHSDSDHKKDRTLQQGQFYLADFEDDPTYKDMPHLFLEKGGHYQEWMVPNGLPTEDDHQKKVIRTDESLDKKDLEAYLRHPAPAGEGEDRRMRKGQPEEPDDLPINNYNELTVEEASERLDDLSDEEVRRLQDYEDDNKNRKTMREAFERRLDET